MRDTYGVNHILGSIHNLIHADDTVILDTNLQTLQSKAISTVKFVKELNQDINISKTKYMCIDSRKSNLKRDLIVGESKIEYSTKEKYLGHYITDDNILYKSLELDVEERASNVLIKFRNFINNNKDASLEIRLKVFQACFCSAILSNCETWGPRIPKKIYVLYHQGIKLALGVRTCTPTALVFMESRQPAVTAIIRKRQLKFWLNLNKNRNTELYNLIERAKDTKYIAHYRNLEAQHKDPTSLYKETNDKFYLQTWNNIKEATPEKSKMMLYHEIYNRSDNMPQNSLSLLCQNKKFQTILTQYIMSSHDLQCEVGKWTRTPKGERLCKQCDEHFEEDVSHFILHCKHFQHIRNSYPEFPKNDSLFNFFNWELSELVLHKLHMYRK